MGKRIAGFGCGVLLALGLGAAVAAEGVSAGALLPANNPPDQGPEVVFKAEPGDKDGTRFDWVDVAADGTSLRYRIYFDRLKEGYFHFLDRAESRLTLGLSEAGVEQMLDRCDLPADGVGNLRIARHGSKIGVFQGPRLLLFAFDDRRVGGTVGVRNFDSGASLSLNAQRREDIRFSDDFMQDGGDEKGDNKGGKESNLWRKYNCGPNQGSFAIRSLRNPLLSANAFNLMGVGKNAMSVRGEPWWDNYRYELALRGPVGGKIGLLFAFQDDKNYGLFRWTARPVNDKAAPSGPGLRELVRVRDGREEVLASSAYGYVPHQWYHAEILVTHARVRVEMDGHALFEIQDPWLTSGAIGVWCDVAKPAVVAVDPKAAPLSINSLWDLMNQHAVFDDVKVNSIESYEDDFSAAGPLSRGWLTGLGHWEVRTPTPGQAGELFAEALPAATKCLIGNARWGQYRIACDVDPAGGSAGLVFLYRDETNHFLARTDGKKLELVEVAEGRETVLGEAPLKSAGSPAKDGYLRLGVMAKDGYFKVTAADGTVVEGYEGQAGLRGRGGLYAAPPAHAGGAVAPIRFRRLRLMFIEAPEPLVTTNAIFEDEETMSEWTSPTKEWLPQQTPILVDGQNVIPLWHSSQFPGDVELAVEPRQILEAQHEVALSVSKDGKGARNGYVFLYQAGRPTEKGGKATILKMLRQGEPVLERVMAEPVRELSSVSLRRAGAYLIGKINGRPELVYHDPEPLTGAKVAYYAKGVAVRSEASQIHSDHCLNEVFSSAPVMWRTASHAIAEVTNRWQCDPRWSFFSLKNDLAFGPGPAILWNKGLYPGDVTVEFFVGNKMEAERGQPYYAYSRDINVSICPDSSDLTKGYAFVWGGSGNKFTAIYRDGVEVKRVERGVVNEQRRVHRAWMSVRIEKRGNRYSLHVDRLPEEPPIDLVFEDPNPIPCNRVAIWTYHHAIMLSRVRISGEGGTVLESPDQEFPAIKTIYDKP